MKSNLFSRKSSIFLLSILAIVLFLSLFAKSTMSEGMNKMGTVLAWAGGIWFYECKVIFDKTITKDIITAKCKDNKGVFKDTVAKYKDCKKYADGYGRITLENNNGKLICGKGNYNDTAELTKST